MYQIAVNLAAQNNIYLLALSSVGQKTGQAQLGSQLRVSQGQNQSVGQVGLFSGGFWKQSASNFIWLVGRI